MSAFENFKDKCRNAGYTVLTATNEPFPDQYTVYYLSISNGPKAIAVIALVKPDGDYKLFIENKSPVIDDDIKAITTAFGETTPEPKSERRLVPCPSYMSEEEFGDWYNGSEFMAFGFTIVPKRDFKPSGCCIEGGEYVHAGWYIKKEGINAIPGGNKWATTIDEAKRMIRCLVAAKGDSDVYHALLALTK